MVLLTLRFLLLIDKARGNGHVTHVNLVADLLLELLVRLLCVAAFVEDVALRNLDLIGLEDGDQEDLLHGEAPLQCREAQFGPQLDDFVPRDSGLEYLVFDLMLLHPLISFGL